MKRLLPLFLLLAAPFLGGCISGGQIKNFLGIRPSMTEYGPFKAKPAEVWEAARDVLADEGYTFHIVKRSEWHIESNWMQYGSGNYMEEHRYQVTFDLEETDGGTLMHLVAEKQLNSGKNMIDPQADEWCSEDADEDLQNDIVYRIRKRLKGNGGGDIYEKTLRRLEEESNNKATERPDYGESR